MRWQREELKAGVTKEWHRWFAWYPINLPDGKSVWFERVWRRTLLKEVPYYGWGILQNGYTLAVRHEYKDLELGRP